MKNKHCLFTGFIFLHIVVHAQVKIGNNSTTINSASLLELETTNKGFVLPRVSLTSTISSSPLASGLLTGTIIYNTNSSTTGGSGAGIYYWDGSKWNFITNTNTTLNYWALIGNSGASASTNFLGTTDNVGFRIRTNNIERLLIDSLGDIGIGSSGFDVSNREKLLIDYGTTTSHTLATLKGSINNYLQINLQNYNSGVSASTDYVATADDGTDSTYYIDMGINSSTYARTAHNWGGAHDGYLYANSRNLLIGTSTSNDIIFMTSGGLTSSNAVLRLKASTGNVVVGKGDNTANPAGNTIRGPNGNGTDIAGGTLTLQGGSATGVATGGSVNVYGGSTVSGTTGDVNINASTNSATNINTGTSTSSVTIGNSSNNILFPKFNIAGGMIYTTAATGQIAGTGSNMSWDDVNNRLGIGVSTPAEKLDVSGNIKFSGALMPNNLPGTSGYFLKSNGAGTTPTWIDMSTISWALGGNSVSAIKNLGTTSNFDLPFITNNTENMRLTTSGYLGIGITTPEDMLHLVNYTPLSATPYSMVTVETRNTITSQGSQPPQLNHIRQIPTSAYASNTQYLGAIENFAFRVPGSATFNNFAQWQGSTLNTNGIIGFATRTGMTNGNPSTGTITGGITTAAGYTYNMVLIGNTLGVANLLGGATTLSTDANGNIIRTPSDAKFKTNVTTIDNALDKVMKLRGVTYNWIDTARFGSSKEIGFIAQEIEKVVPEVVKSGGDYKSVNYQVITALLAEAIKEQQKQIEQQTAKMQSLQTALDEQQKTINLLVEQIKKLQKK